MLGREKKRSANDPCDEEQPRPPLKPLQRGRVRRTGLHCGWVCWFIAYHPVPTKTVVPLVSCVFCSSTGREKHVRKRASAGREASCGERLRLINHVVYGGWERRFDGVVFKRRERRRDM